MDVKTKLDLDRSQQKRERGLENGSTLSKNQFLILQNPIISKVYDVIATVYRGREVAIHKFYNSIYTLTKNEKILHSAPLVMFHPIKKLANKGVLLFYPNISFLNYEFFLYGDKVCHRWVIELNQTRMNTDIIAILENKNRKDFVTDEKAWAKYFLKAEEIKLSKYLSKYLFPYSKGDEIADMASSILGDFEPYKLQFAQSPEEYIFAYETGPSTCMTFSDTSNLGTQTLLSSGSHPACWYHYAPSIGLAYLKRGTKCIARCLITKNKKGKVTGRGKIYGINDVIKKELITLLEKEKIYSKNSFTIEGKFSIPAILTTIKDKNVGVCPFPYLDNVESSFFIKYDEEEKVFEWTPTTKKELKNKGLSYGTISEFGLVWSGKSTIGYINSDDCKSQFCTVCNASIIKNINHDGGEFPTFATSTRDTHLVAEDGTIFCTSSCRKTAKYVMATRSDGREALIPSKDVIVDPAYPMKFFTTTNSVKENGGIPFLLYPWDNINPKTLTVSPDVITVKKISDGKLVDCGLFASSFYSTLEQLPEYSKWVVGIDPETTQIVFTNSDEDGLPVQYEDTHDLIKTLSKVA